MSDIRMDEFSLFRRPRVTDWGAWMKDNHVKLKEDTVTDEDSGSKSKGDERRRQRKVVCN